MLGWVVRFQHGCIQKPNQHRYRTRMRKRDSPRAASLVSFDAPELNDTRRGVSVCLRDSSHIACIRLSKLSQTDPTANVFGGTPLAVGCVLSVGVGASRWSVCGVSSDWWLERERQKMWRIASFIAFAGTESRVHLEYADVERTSN